MVAGPAPGGPGGESSSAAAPRLRKCAVLSGAAPGEGRGHRGPAPARGFLPLWGPAAADPSHDPGAGSGPAGPAASPPREWEISGVFRWDHGGSHLGDPGSSDASVPYGGEALV